VIAAVIEYSLSHPRERKAREPLVETFPEAEPVVTDAVRVIPRMAEPPAAELEEPEPEPVAAEPEEPEPEPEPEPVAVEPEPVEPELELEPELEPEPELELEPELEPEPEPELEPEPVEPRQWNLWEIDRALRDSGEATEEQEFLLMYLRDYAGPDGSLPLDFDDLVRESFGDVLGTPAG
jgi:hypothetical protein